MTLFSFTHLIFLLVTIVFLLATMYLVSKLNKTGQYIMFIIATIICCGGIFFRYAMGLKFTFDLNHKAFLVQMLQVCNFNFVLLILMLFKKCELARQYAIYFSMFAASTALVSVPSDWANYEWNNIYILNSWFNHTFAIALPLWMLAARVLKPQKEYILKVTICVVSYFIGVFAIMEILKHFEIISEHVSYSFIYDTLNVPIFDILYKLIPIPCFYLSPLIPFMVVFFIILFKIFKNYKVNIF